MRDISLPRRSRREEALTRLAIGDWRLAIEPSESGARTLVRFNANQSDAFGYFRRTNQPTPKRAEARAPFRIPMGFRPKAQGCACPAVAKRRWEARATLGQHEFAANPDGVASPNPSLGQKPKSRWDFLPVSFSDLVLLLACLSFLVPISLHAATRTGGPYTVHHEVIDSAGQSTTGGPYSAESSFTELSGVTAQGASILARQGYLAQINTGPVTNLTLTNYTTTFGASFSLTLSNNTFLDPDFDEALSYSVTGLPAGLSFNPTNLQFSGSPTTAGNYPITVISSDHGEPVFSQSTTFTLSVGKAAPLLTWTNPADIIYGVALGSTQLSATANTAGTFSYTPPLGTLLNASNAQSLRVVFTPADAANYISATNTTAINVLKAPLTVTATNITRNVGASNPAFTASITSFVNGETSSVVSGVPAFSTTATAASPAGTYPIVPSLGTLQAANYNFTNFVNGTLTVLNTPPVANAQSLTLAEDTTKAVTLTGSDPEGSVLTFSITTAPSHGDLSGIPPNLTYLPNPNYNGSDSFAFVVHDGQFSSIPATISLTITSAADTPTISSMAALTMVKNDSSSVSFSIGDSDTPLTNLVVTAQSSNTGLVPNQTSSLNVTGAGASRSLNITPAQGQSGTATISVAVSDGVGSASTSFLLTVTSGGNTNKNKGGKGIHGYVAQGQVFFDANRNGVLDANEPSTQTDGQGNFSLAISLADFDTNHNGDIENDEGRLVLSGGTDIATGLPLAVGFAAPMDASVVTPLTTILEELQRQNSSLTSLQSEQLLGSSLGFPSGVTTNLSLRSYDPFDAALLNDTNAALVQAASAAVYDTLVQTSSLLEGASGGSASPQSTAASSGSQISRKSLIQRMATASAPKRAQISASVIQAFAAKVQSAGRLNLSVASDVKQLIEQSAATLNVSLPAATIAGAAAVVAEINKAKDTIVASGLTTGDALARITQVQHVAQAEAAVELKALGAGTVAVDDVVFTQTGLALNAAIQTAPVGDLSGFDTRPGIISFSRADFQVREGGAALQAITLNRDNGTRGEINVLLTLSDGTATAASGDYTTTVLQVRFADREISRVIDLTNRVALDGRLEGNETIQLSVALAPGAPTGAAIGWQRTATLTVVDADSPGVFAFTGTEFNVRENGAEPNSVTLARTGGTLGTVTVVITPSAITGGAAVGADFVASPISVTFAPGAQYRTVTIPVIRDSVTEGNERFQLALSLAANSPAGAALGDQRTAIVTILDVPNTAPMANSRTIVAQEDTAMALTLTGQDAEGDTLTFVMVTPPTRGSLTGTAPNLVYLPGTNFNGNDSFTFKANDGLVDSVPATIALAVKAVNDAPVLANAIPAQSGIYGTAFNYVIAANAFADVDAGQTLTYSATNLPPGITLDGVTRALNGKPTSVGSFNVTIKATDNGTPALSASNSFVFAIAKAPLLVTAGNFARDYGLTNPPLTGSLAGVVDSNRITVTFSTTATATSPVGTYPIVPSLLDPDGKLGNYIVTTNNGTLTVRNVPPVVNAGPDQLKVAGDVVTFTGSFTDPSSPSQTTGWNFGDGSPVVVGTLTPTHIFTNRGVYTVTLAVTDSHLAGASDTLIVTVISAFGSASNAAVRVRPFVNESERVDKMVKDLTNSLNLKFWLGEMHLNPKGGRNAFVYWRQAADMMEQLLKPGFKRPNDPQDLDDGDDDDEFKKIFNNSKTDTLSASALAAVRLSMTDVILASRLISETEYLENEGLKALDPRKQKRVDAALARGKDYLEQANALVLKGDFGTAVRRYISSWNNTQDAMEIASQSQPAKELVKAQDLVEESLDPKYWVDEFHLLPATGAKAFELMQSAARELENVVEDAQKGRVVAAIGQQAAEELADLVAKARRVSRTLYLEKEHLVAVNSKNQKAVDSDLKDAKADLDKGLAAEAAGDFDKALNSYASSWDHTTQAIEQAAKTK
jgi:hypothetical protein